MTLGEYIALGSVATGLVLNAITYGWKGGSAGTTMKAAIDALAEQQKKIDARYERLERVPLLEQRIEYLERNHSLIPGLKGDIEVLKAHQQHSRELRAVMRRSRPDTDEE